MELTKRDVEIAASATVARGGRGEKKSKWEKQGAREMNPGQGTSILSQIPPKTED